MIYTVYQSVCDYKNWEVLTTTEDVNKARALFENAPMAIAFCDEHDIWHPDGIKDTVMGTTKKSFENTQVLLLLPEFCTHV